MLPSLEPFLGGGTGAAHESAQVMLLAVARTVAVGALKTGVQAKRVAEQPRYLCVRLWDSWMRTASLQV